MLGQQQQWLRWPLHTAMPDDSEESQLTESSQWMSPRSSPSNTQTYSESSVSGSWESLSTMESLSTINDPFEFRSQSQCANHLTWTPPSVRSSERGAAYSPWTASPCSDWHGHSPSTPVLHGRSRRRSDPVSRGAQMRALWSRDRFLQRTNTRKFDLSGYKNDIGLVTPSRRRAAPLVPTYVPPHEKRRDMLRMQVHQQLVNFEPF